MIGRELTGQNSYATTVFSRVLYDTFSPEASFGLRVLSLPASVCLCVRPSVYVCRKHLLVRAITHHPFKLESPNLEYRCKRPWLRSPLFWGVIDLDLQGQNLPHFELVRAITHHPFKLGPPNLDQTLSVQDSLVKIPIVLGVDWAWQVKFNLFSKSCLFASLLCLWHICETCKNGWKRSLLHILHGYAHICSPTGSCHGPWNSRVVSWVWPLLASQSSTRRLTMGFLMLL